MGFRHNAQIGAVARQVQAARGNPSRQMALQSVAQQGIDAPPADVAAASQAGLASPGAPQAGAAQAMLDVAVQGQIAAGYDPSAAATPIGGDDADMADPPKKSILEQTGTKERFL